MITRILELVHQINEETAHYAFMNYSGHVESVDVRVEDVEGFKLFWTQGYFGGHENLNSLSRNHSLEEMVDQLENYLKEERTHATA